MLKASAICITCLLLVGCATRGRLSVVDIDLRTTDQIVAYQQEAAVIYQSQEKEQPSTGMTGGTWDFIIKLVEVIKGRIRILSFEWVK